MVGLGRAGPRLEGRCGGRAPLSLAVPSPGLWIQRNRAGRKDSDASPSTLHPQTLAWLLVSPHMGLWGLDSHLSHHVPSGHGCGGAQRNLSYAALSSHTCDSGLACFSLTRRWRCCPAYSSCAELGWAGSGERPLGSLVPGRFLCLSFCPSLHQREVLGTYETLPRP